MGITKINGRSVVKKSEPVVPAGPTVDYKGHAYPVLSEFFKTPTRDYEDESSYKGGDGMTVGTTYRMVLIKVAGEYRELTFKSEDTEIVFDRPVSTAEGYVLTLPVGLHIELTPTVPTKRMSGCHSTVSYYWDYNITASFAGKPINLSKVDLARLKRFASDIPANATEVSGINAY